MGFFYRQTATMKHGNFFNAQFTITDQFKTASRLTWKRQQLWKRPNKQSSNSTKNCCGFNGVVEQNVEQVDSHEAVNQQPSELLPICCTNYCRACCTTDPQQTEVRECLHAKPKTN